MNVQVGFAHKVVAMMESGAHTGDGTSAATPMVAGMFATLNGVRYDHGLPPLGFVNPLLYHHAPSVSVANTPFRDTTAGGENVAMFDITQGHNDGCTGTGYYSTIGWDPATGLGIPNYPALKKIITSMKMAKKKKKKRTTKGGSKH